MCFFLPSLFQEPMHFQQILSFCILLEIQTLKASNHFLSALLSPSVYCIEYHTPDKIFDKRYN